MPRCHLPPTIRRPSFSADRIVTFASQEQYHITNRNIPEVWTQTQGDGVNVAVLDTGLDTYHVDFEGTNVARLINFTSSGHRAKVVDRDGHGTHVGGIIAANNDGDGVVGVAPKVNLFIVKVLGDDGSGDYDWVVSGINQAVEWGADVINMSLGGSEGTTALHDAIKRAYEKGVAIVCASGNDGDTRQVEFPARYPETITIGALTASNARATFSQTGSNLDFMSPGVDIVSCIPMAYGAKPTSSVGKYAAWSGTSMATAWATGVVALLISKHRKYGGATPINGVEDVREHLKKAAIDMSDPGRDIQTGFGIIDVTQLIGDEETPAPAQPLTIDERVTLLEREVEMIKERL